MTAGAPTLVVQSRSPAAWRRAGQSTGFVSIAALVWAGLWAGINSGPWVLAEEPAGLLGWAHYLRTLFPLAALAIACIAWVGRQALWTDKGVWVPGPLRLWVAYGVVGLVACILSPEPLHAIYWAACYLSVFAVLGLYVGGHGGERALRRILQLNYLSWGLVAALFGAVVVTARHVLLVPGEDGLTAYGVINRMGEVGGMPMSRSSGMSRMASVPCIVAFLLMWTRRGLGGRLAWGAVVIGTGLLVYWAQSRGSILGLGVALGFCVMFLGRRARWLGAVAVVLFGVAVVGEVVPRSWMHDVTRHLTRDTAAEELLTLGGRTATWEKTWDAFAKSPVIGSGPQADRYLLHEHVHNAYLYAALQGGLLGLALFVGGLAWAWRAFFRALRSGVADRLGQRTALIATGAVLAFFTVRSIPEVCGAMYAIDLLLMVPAMAYLAILSRMSREPHGGVAQ